MDTSALRAQDEGVRTRRRLLAALVLLPLLAVLAPAAEAAADGQAAARSADGGPYLLSGSARFSEHRSLRLTAESATSKRVTLLSHSWAIDTEGDRRPELYAVLERFAGPSLVDRRYRSVRCPGLTGRLYAHRSTTDLGVPGSCLERDGARPDRVAVTPSVLVRVRHPRGDSCESDRGHRLRLEPGQGAGFATAPSPQPRRGC